MTRKIVLATIGTFGDLHPFLALARGLQARGFHPVLGCPADHLAKARAAGVEAVTVLPGFEEICARMGAEKSDAARRIMGNQRQMFERVILPDLAISAGKLERLAEGAVAMVCSPFVLGAPIAAEKARLPLVSTVLQPMAMLSALDPPNTRDFAMMKHAPVGMLGAGWNRFVYASIWHAIHLAYGRKIAAARRSYGLPARAESRIFEPSGTSALTLGLYSRHFAPLPQDAPDNSLLVGFPAFDSAQDPCSEQDRALEAFLADGPPPLVFTLGTFAVHAAGRFYDEAERTARALGMRAVLLTGKAAAPQRDGSIFRCDYAPHSRLFPRAAIVIHHGGVGTIGQALRAGKPQLVVPHMGDQHDHAHRIKALGVGDALRPGRFARGAGESAILALLQDRQIPARAAALAASIAREDAPAAAAAAIEAMLARRNDAVAPVRAMARAAV